MVVVTVNGVVISMEERQETNPDELPTSDIDGEPSSSTRSHTHANRFSGGSSRIGGSRTSETTVTETENNSGRFGGSSRFGRTSGGSTT